MTIEAALAIEDTPLGAIAARLSASARGEGANRSPLAVHAFHGDDPADAPPVAEAQRTLYWGLAPRRLRVGPVVGPGEDGCATCLSYWLDHNRPDAAQWRALPGAASPPLAAYPWHPLVYHLLEAVSGDLLAEAGRGFVDIDPDTLRVAAHRYQPSPDCPRCTPRTADAPELATRPSAHRPKPSPARFRARAMPPVAELRSRYCDYRVGLVRHMYRERNSDLLPMWGAESKLPRLDLSEVGYGRHRSARLAEGVAILEALERYCGFASRRRTPSVRGSHAELVRQGLTVADPRDFILSGAGQAAEPGYALAAYAPERAFDWIWGYSFRHDAPILVPVQFCFYGPPVTPRGELFVIETSNGCALGGSFEEAAFHGLLELVERDAYMTRWHVQGRPRRIDLTDPAMPDVRQLYARVIAEGYELHAFSIGLEVPVPTVLAMIVDPRADAGVASYCASGAHPVAAEAVFGALVEVCSSIGVYQGQFSNQRQRARELLASSAQVQEMRDHVLLYSLPEALARLAFLDRGSAPALAAELFAGLESQWRGGDLGVELSALAASVCRVASDVILVDQSADLIAPLDLHCVKVLAPGLHPVTFGHQYRRISPTRLASARRHLEEKGEACAAGINPHPHNFP